MTAAGASGQFTGLPEHVEAGDLDGDGASDLMGTGATGLAVAFGPWTAANWDFMAEAEVNVGDRPAAALAWNADWLFMATSSDDWQPPPMRARAAAGPAGSQSGSQRWFPASIEPKHGRPWSASCSAPATGSLLATPDPFVHVRLNSPYRAFTRPM